MPSEGKYNLESGKQIFLGSGYQTLTGGMTYSLRNDYSRNQYTPKEENIQKVVVRNLFLSDKHLLAL
jgi:hypothetical protein